MASLQRDVPHDHASLTVDGRADRMEPPAITVQVVGGAPTCRAPLTRSGRLPDCRQGVVTGKAARYARQIRRARRSHG